MIKNSNIQWTSATWNPWQGCTKKTIELNGGILLREECRNCYMYRDKKRYGQKPQIVIKSKPVTFNKPIRLQREYDLGVRSNVNKFVFTCSWSDFFNPEADAWRLEAWEIIRQCPGLIFQILTKLPERIGDCLPPFWDEIKGRVWLGYSCGMPGAEKLISSLINFDSEVRFLSCEPLLGALDLSEWFNYFGPHWQEIDWVIIGGESGPNARKMDLDIARDLIWQCREADVPVFVKQLGTVWAKEVKSSDYHGGNINDWPAELRIREFPGVYYEFLGHIK